MKSSNIPSKLKGKKLNNSSKKLKVSANPLGLLAENRSKKKAWSNHSLESFWNKHTETKSLMLAKALFRSARYLLRCRAAGRPDYWSAQKVKNFEIIVGPGLGTLKKPKYHYMVVGGLLVQELEPLKDLKAEKGWFFGQN